MDALKILVLAKQVPDTRNVGKNAMKADGTVNRSALPAIFNPEDLNAVEQGLRMKDRFPKSTVQLMTMGPGRAAEIIRESLYRGADGGYLISDRKFAGADTLATSYVLAKAVEKYGRFDLILCGRQAIDGDTAQVGPQVAEKLGIPQVTYAEEIIDIKQGRATIRRRLEHGIEVIEAKLPLLVTVHGSAAPCRYRNAKLLMKYKHARTDSELQNRSEDYLQLHNVRPGLHITEWSVDDLNVEEDRLGLAGSPTKVKSVENVVFTAAESKVLEDPKKEINDLIRELIEKHIIG